MPLTTFGLFIIASIGFGFFIAAFYFKQERAGANQKARKESEEERNSLKEKLLAKDTRLSELNKEIQALKSLAPMNGGFDESKLNELKEAFEQKTAELIAAERESAEEARLQSQHRIAELENHVDGITRDHREALARQEALAQEAAVAREAAQTHQEALAAAIAQASEQRPSDQPAEQSAQTPTADVNIEAKIEEAVAAAREAAKEEAAQQVAAARETLDQELARAREEKEQEIASREAADRALAAVNTEIVRLEQELQAAQEHLANQQTFAAQIPTETDQIPVAQVDTAQLEALQHQIASFQEQNEGLRQQAENAREYSQSLQQENETLQQQRSSFEQQSQSLQQQSDDLQQQIATLQQQFESSQKQLEATQQQIESLQQPADGLAQQDAVLKLQNETLQQQIEALREQNQNLQQQLIALQEETSSLESDLATANASIRQADTESSLLREESTELRRLYEEAETKNIESSTSIARQLADIREQADESLAAARASATEEISAALAVGAEEVSAVRASTAEEIVAAKTAAAEEISAVKTTAADEIALAQAIAEEAISVAKAAAEQEVVAAKAAATEEIAAARKAAETQIADALQARDEAQEKLLQAEAARETEAQQAAASTASTEEFTALKNSLARLEGNLAELASERGAAMSSLAGEVAGLARTVRSTSAPASNWKGLSLRRAVEVAGLASRCQQNEEGTVVRVPLAEGHSLILDARLSSEPYFEAAQAEGAERDERMAAHAAAVRAHVERLGELSANTNGQTPELQVAFMPSELMYASAVERDSALVDFAAERNVLLATPVTLVALLRAVQFGWRQEDATEQAHAVVDLGRAVCDGVERYARQTDELRASLENTLLVFNRGAASFDADVLGSVRNFRTAAGGPIPEPGITTIDAAPRALYNTNGIDALQQAIEVPAPEAEAVA